MAAVALASPAVASEQPVLAPAGEWVQAVTPPVANPAAADKPFQTLLVSAQSRRDDAAIDYFFEYATLVQDPQALSALGTIAIPWNPGRGTLTVHKVHILRGGTAIDLLAKQQLSVLRRETNLENAVIDGTLTAMLQAEGLSVGDVLNVAFTVRSRDPETISFRTERLASLPSGQEVGRFHLRDVWPAQDKVRWSGKGPFAKPKLKETAFGKELSVDLRNVVLPDSPEDVPQRFRLGPTLDVSGYATWEEVGRLLQPAFFKARQIGPESELRAEIAAIAKTASDPQARAMAALRLVQDKIRYVALAIGDGGYVPASAEETWRRKFGDCKAKTVTLLALLDGLGIDAEPVLVSTQLGDGLPERLPMVGPFDHILVRARINGKSYWLDGTTTGDRDIEALASAPFRWGLPVRSSGSALEAIAAAPPPWPVSETEAVLDASGGFHRPVPFTVRTVYRGAEAASQSAAFAQTGREAIRKRLREVAAAKETDFEISELDFKKDEAAGTFTLVYSGKRLMDWSPVPGSKASRYQFDRDTVEWNAKFDRAAGPFADLPFSLNSRLYIASRETIILPGGGKGFTLEGTDIDESASGAHITRKLTLERGRATAYSTFRFLKPEVDAAEARAGAAALKRINASEAYVRSPADYSPSEAELKAIKEEEPKTARGYVERGYWSMTAGAYKAALADFDKAAALSPEWSVPLANRAIVLIHQDKLDDAGKSLEQAAALADDDFVVHQGLGLLHLARDKPDEAVTAFSRSLHLDPDNDHTLLNRALAYEQLGLYRQALADILAAIRLDPNSVGAMWRAARLHAELGERDAALAQFETAFEQAPEDMFLRASNGEFLTRFGRKQEAAAAFAAALAIIDKQMKEDPSANQSVRIQTKVTILSAAGRHREAIDTATAGLKRYVDHIDLLAERCNARAFAKIELDQAMKDCKLAAELDPERVGTAQARGLLELQRQDWDAAIRIYSAALGWEPRDPRCFYGRALAKSRKGDKAGADKDFTLARRYGFDTGAEFDTAGLRP
jgi:tetratricopeptide (TPR) repeat protein